MEDRREWRQKKIEKGRGGREKKRMKTSGRERERERKTERRRKSGKERKHKRKEKEDETRWMRRGPVDVVRGWGQASPSQPEVSQHQAGGLDSAQPSQTQTAYPLSCRFEV